MRGRQWRPRSISGGRQHSEQRLTGDGLTDEDRAGVPRALELRVDLIAQSFVRNADDVRALRALLPADGPRLVAKIETRAAVDDFDDDLRQVADGIMVARGDLGVDIPFEEVPLVQKDLVRRATAAGRFAIVATQMLESMTGAPRPTRAEASDVANAVLDGADAVMLSAETAIGAVPDRGAPGDGAHLPRRPKRRRATRRAAGRRQVRTRRRDHCRRPLHGDHAHAARRRCGASPGPAARLSCCPCSARASRSSHSRSARSWLAASPSAAASCRWSCRRPARARAAHRTDGERVALAEGPRATMRPCMLVTTSHQPAGINRLEIHKLGGRWLDDQRGGRSSLPGRADDGDTATQDELRHPEWTTDWPQRGESSVRSANNNEILRNYPGGARGCQQTRLMGSEDRWAPSPVGGAVPRRRRGRELVGRVADGLPDGRTWTTVILISCATTRLARESVLGRALPRPSGAPSGSTAVEQA